MTAVTHMEWLKIRSVRSTAWALLIFAAGMIGAAMLVLGRHHGGGSFDATNAGFSGLVIGQLAVGVLGVLAVTSEYSSGMIRATLAAAPRRPLVLAAKAAVLAAIALAAGEVLAFAAFTAGQAVLPAPAARAALGQPGVLRAVLMAGAYPALIGLTGLGLGAVIRHTAGAISALTGTLFVLPLMLVPFGPAVQDAGERFLPMIIAENSLTAVTPVPDSLSPGAGFGLLCLYAAAALAAGGWVLARRDA